MGTLTFDDEPDSLDGYDADEPGEGLSEEVVEDAPVPGYVPQEGDVLPEASAEAVALVDVEEDYGAVMDQVDRRMKVANYYRLVLDGDLFGGDQTSEAKLAQNRIRKYVREELEILLGMRKTASSSAAPAVVVSPFSDDEISALKELARLAIRKLKAEPSLQPIVAKPAVAAPVLKPVTPPTAASVVPVVKKPAPAPVAPKPVAKPAAAPVQQPKPAPKPQAPQAKVSGDPRIPEQYRADPTAKVVNGKVFVQARDEDNNLIFVTHPKTKRKIPSMKDVTPVARPVGVQPMPMPSFAVMEQQAVMQAQSNVGQLSALAARNPNIAALAGAAALHLSGAPTQQQNPDEALSGDERPY